MKAQTQVTIGAGTTADYFYGPIYRSSAGSGFDYSRYWYLYDATELALAGLPAGAIITKIEWEKVSTSDINNTGNATFNIFMNNTAATALVSGTDWATATATATSVLSRTFNNTATYPTVPGNVATTAGWMEFPLTTSFVYTGGSLEVLADWDISAVANNPTSGSFTWNYATIPGTKALGIANSVALTGTTQLTTTYGGGVRPNIRITYTPATACTGLPSAGIASGVSSVCPATPVAVSLSGATIASGLAYQWQTSPDNIAWSNAAGATNPAYSTLITGTTYFRCIVTCTAASLADTSTTHMATLNPPLQCYCIPTYTNGTGSGDYIGQVQLGSLNNITTGAPSPYYTSYGTTVTVPTVSPGLSYTLTVAPGTWTSGNTIAAWMDYDQNGTFDATEKLGETTINAAFPTTGAIAFNVPVTALGGQTVMRVREVWNSTNLDPCLSYGYGETEDYLVDMVPLVGCLGMPSAGQTASSDSSVCSTDVFTLSLPGVTLAANVTYQWQSSSDNITWANIAGASNTFYSTSQSDTTWYRCVVTCTNTSQADTSNALQILMNSFLSCYCASAPQFTGDEDIFEVSLNGTPNASTCASVGPGPGSVQNLYSNYTTLPPVTCFIGTAVPFSVVIGTCGTNWNNATKIYIDYNQNGSFADPGEEVFTMATAVSGPNTQSGTILIPVGTTPGITMMRVVNNETTPANISPCGSYFYGETEDYFVNMVQPVPCNGAFAGNTASSDSSVCSGQNFTLSMPNTTITSGLVYEWQVSNDSITWSTIAGATNIVATTSQTDTSWYRCIITCATASAADTSDALKIVMAPFLSCYCGSQASFTWNSDIGQVVLGGFANPTVAPPVASPSAALYTDFTTLAPGPQLTQGGVTPISVLQIDQFGIVNSALSVYIDFDHNGTFDLAENVFNSGSANGNPMAGSVLVPMTAQLGLTGMRVILTNYGTTPLDPCVTYGTGETEDYFVNIVAPIPQNGQMVAIYSPGSGCGLTACEDISFEVRNAGSDSLSAIGYAYSINNGAPISAVFTPGIPLAPGDIASIVVGCGMNLATPGTYTLKVYTQVVGDTDPMLDTLTKTIVSIPTITTFPYVQNFDNSADPTGGWVSGGTSNAWGLVTPAKSVINTAASAPNSWITNPSGIYSNNEKSWVQSPCLDLTSLALPILELSVWWDCEFSWDGMIVQSSTDGGVTWTNIGGLGTGQNWYNDGTVAGMSGLGTTQEAWSGSGSTGSGGWLNAKHTLTGLGGLSGVLLRVAFGADPSVNNYNGVAFDDVMIYDTPADDMSADEILSPVSGDCGDDSTAVMVVIKNTGLNAQANFPVTVAYNNGAGSQGTFTTTYLPSLAPGGVDTIFVGTFNSLVGGNYALAAYTDLSNDGFHLNDTTEMTVYINSVPNSPVANDVYKCLADSFLLSVQTPGASMFYTWYDSISGGTLLDTGVAFMTPFLTQSTPYYVAVQGQAVYQINTPVNGGSGTTWFGYQNEGLEFTNTYAMTLDSVTVTPTSTGLLQLVVLDPFTGAVIDSGVVATIATANVPVRIPVGVHVSTPGTYYLMAAGTSTVTDLLYNWSGANFPYNAGGVSIDDNTDGSGTFGSYYFYYDWQVTTLGCPSERTPVQAGIYPTPVVMLGADYSACGGDTLDAGAGWSTITWSYDNAVIGNTQTLFADTSGAYSAIITDVNGCVGGDTINIQINPLPVVSLGNDTTACGSVTIDAGNPASTFAWGCDAVPTFSQTLTVAISGTYCVTVTNTFGCQASDTKVVTINQLPQVNLGNDIQTCTPATLGTVTPIPNSTCQWTLPGGATDPNCTITASTAGTYVLQVTDAQGCVGSDDVVVTFQAPPSVNIGGGATDTVCTSKVLSAGNAGSTYLWTTPAGNATTQAVTATTTGLYKVVVTNAIGCTGTDSATVVINTTPANLSFSTGYTGKPFEYIFTVGSTQGLGITYDWTFTDGAGGVTTATGSSVTIQFPATPDFYEVKVTATNACGNTSFSESLFATGLANGLDAAISVYPNPTDGVAYVNITGLSQDVRLTVYDANGRILMSRTVAQFEQRDALKLDLSEFAKGTYLMRFDTEQGTATRKVTLK